MIKKILILLSLAGILLAGCGTFSVSANPISVEEATATVAARGQKPAADGPSESATEESSEDAVDDTMVPTPTIVPTPEAGSTLPKPLYYLNPGDQQVWRVEQDGVTLTKISNEASAIEAYDVNPADGSLVLLSDNSLILTDALGGNRREIVNAPSEEEAGVHWYLFARITNPVWSADGATLAYGLNGVNFYEMGSDSSRVVIPNDEFPAEGEEVRRPILMYMPHSFSPDGSFLLVMVGWYQAGGGVPSVLRLNTAAPLVELQGAGFPCCTFRWGQDSASIFSANNTFGMFEPGLWRSDAATGETDVIMPIETGDEDVRVFNWPHDMGSGEIAVFYGEGPRSAFESGQPTLMTISTVDVQSGAVTGGLGDYWIPGEAVWLADGSGVAITDVRGESSNTNTWPYVGPLTYIPLDGSDVLTLPVAAHVIHWGIAE